MAVHVLKRTLWLFLAEATVPVSITSPACGSTITNANVTVVWSFSPGTQYSYHLVLYSDALLTNVVYDSGLVVSGAMTASIPFGILSNATTYYATVAVVLTDGTEGQSSACAWTTSFSPSAGVTGVVLDMVGACGGDPTELPGVLVSWTRIVPGVNETFLEYDVKRRVVGTTAWERIAIITTISLVHYVDYTVMPGESYQYAITWAASFGPSILVSSEQSNPPSATPEWDFFFLHEVINPDVYIRFDTIETDEKIEQVLVYVLVAGRRQPIAQVGEQQYKVWHVPALERPLDDTDMELWDTLSQMLTDQRESGAIFCARYGIAHTGMFCQFAAERSIKNQQQEISADLREVFYYEFV